MFKSINIIGNNYHIIDSDFENKLYFEDYNNTITFNIFYRVLDAIIKTYGNKNLNIPKNIVCAINYYHKIWGFNINEIIYYFSNNPNYAKYKDDVEKYLILL